MRSSNSSSSPGTCWGPSSSFPSGHLHNLPAPARLPCSVSSQEGTDFSVLLSYRAEVGTSYFLNALQSFSVLSVTQFSQHPRQNSPKMIFWVNCGMFMDSLILTLAFLKTVFFFYRIYSRQAVKDLLISCGHLLYLKAWSAFMKKCAYRYLNCTETCR